MTSLNPTTLAPDQASARPGLMFWLAMGYFGVMLILAMARSFVNHSTRAPQLAGWDLLLSRGQVVVYLVGWIPKVGTLIGLRRLIAGGGFSRRTVWAFLAWGPGCWLVFLACLVASPADLQIMGLDAMLTAQFAFGVYNLRFAPRRAPAIDPPPGPLASL